MSEELKITKTSVLAAAAKCPDAKLILETMFPEVFKLDQLTGGICTINSISVILPRTEGPHQGSAFWLSRDFNWQITSDTEGCLCLVPQRL